MTLKPSDTRVVLTSEHEKKGHTELTTTAQHMAAYLDMLPCISLCHTQWDIIPGPADVSTLRLSVAVVLASSQLSVDEDDGDDDY